MSSVGSVSTPQDHFWVMEIGSSLGTSVPPTDKTDITPVFEHRSPLLGDR